MKPKICGKSKWELHTMKQKKEKKKGGATVEKREAQPQPLIPPVKPTIIAMQSKKDIPRDDKQQ